MGRLTYVGNDEAALGKRGNLPFGNSEVLIGNVVSDSLSHEAHGDLELHAAEVLEEYQGGLASHCVCKNPA